MTIDQINALVGSLGFPIIAFGAMFWYMITEHRELRKVIDNNTKALVKILEHIREDSDDGK